MLTLFNQKDKGEKVYIVCLALFYLHRVNNKAIYTKVILITCLYDKCKQGRKRPLDTAKRMIERREREGEREKGTGRDIEREGEIRE